MITLQSLLQHSPDRQITDTRARVQEIATDKILETKQAQGINVEFPEGSVWVTLDGGMRDVILDAGCAFAVYRK